ncbi:hypothetical protein F511_39214 [Dorcoceras hygrometricum]|uniref:Uncharacterized protein n=1 Tax=Dorcoceras hygrometricum TaxID=472368 RepID=A0A2Z7CBT5_9LAMI|nr:hypothetical protein F511_39214 [Dorcoceras hygrometricum]
MKHECRLLNDILAKAITVKAGSFDSVTVERFQMMTAIHYGLKVNWSKVLFNVLKDMVDRSQRKAKGFAAQIGVLLKGMPTISMGDGVPFPSAKILSMRTVHTYIVTNTTIDARAESEEPGMAKTVVEKNTPKAKKKTSSADEMPVDIFAEIAASKKRSATEADAPIIPKKRRMGKSKLSVSQVNLDIVQVAPDVEPLQIVDPTHAVAAVPSPVLKRKSRKRRLVLSRGSDDESVGTKEIVKDADAAAVASTDEEDIIIAKVLEETLELGHSNKSTKLNVQPDSSLPVIDSIDSSGVRLDHFYSIANSTCWVRPVILVNGVWTPVQGPDFWRSGCRLSLFLNKMKIPAPAIQEIFVPHVSFIEPIQYLTAVPWLIRIWQWTKVCEEIVQFSMIGGLRPVREDICQDITVYNLGVECIPANFIRMFAQGVACHSFVDSVVQRDLGDLQEVVLTDVEEVDLVSSDVSTVYRSPSPFSPAVDSFENDWRLALGPAIFSLVEQEERLYIVQSPESSPAISPHHASSSSPTDVSMHFDSTDVPVNAQAHTQASASVYFTKFTEALEDLRSSLAQHIHDSNCEMLSKLNAVEVGVRGDLLKVQSLLRQSFETACRVLERQGNIQTAQITDLKKGLMAPVGTIFQDLFDIKKKQREQDARLITMDEQIAAIRSEHLTFQSKIAADILSLSTQVGDIADYLRGGAAKKGEMGSSSRPSTMRTQTQTFPPTTGTFEERVEQARRHIIETGQVLTHTQASASVYFTKFTEALEDLRSSLAQHIHDSNCEMLSKLNAVEVGVRGDLLKVQSLLRQSFETACRVLERQSNTQTAQIIDLKKGLMAPVGTIFQDLFDIKKKQREQDARLITMDEQIASIRSEHLDFQSKIAADILSLSTQVGDIADYLRGGSAKKGEIGSSSRPSTVRTQTQMFPPTTGTFEERVEQARRHIIETGKVISI